MDRSLVRKVLYPAYRALKRDSVLTRLAEMRRVQAMEPDAIREYQWEKLRTILTYAAKHVPYYRDMFDRLGAAPEDIKCETDLGMLPIVRKRDIRANPEAFVSDCYPGKHLTQDSTGGSTGEIRRRSGWSTISHCWSVSREPSIGQRRYAQLVQAGLEPTSIYCESSGTAPEMPPARGSSSRCCGCTRAIRRS